MIDSKFADMKNTGGRDGGSITAAQLLQRFVDKTPWAHLDIAGTGMGSPQSDINKSWASGFGVRLLDRLVAEHHEKYISASQLGHFLKRVCIANEFVEERALGFGALKCFVNCFWDPRIDILFVAHK